MLTSISPLGERARASRWWLTTTAYVVSSALGGIAVGTLAALLGGLVPEDVRSSPVVLVGVALALLAGLLLDLGFGGLRLPIPRRTRHPARCDPPRSGRGRSRRPPAGAGRARPARTSPTPRR